jgi:hypothetical protein
VVADKGVAVQGFGQGECATVAVGGCPLRQGVVVVACAVILWRTVGRSLSRSRWVRYRGGRGMPKLPPRQMTRQGGGLPGVCGELAFG